MHAEEFGQCIPARRRRLLFFALLLATVTLPALAPHSVRASSEKPFHANFITHFTSVLEFPLLHLSVHGKGNAYIVQADPETSADDAEIGNRPTSCWPRLSKRFFA